jgi:hypothetical protein
MPAIIHRRSLQEVAENHLDDSFRLIGRKAVKLEVSG